MTATVQKSHADAISVLIAKMRVIVCCGAGGVGKTTSSAAIALAAARRGRKVLVLTVDPSRRLAEALGVERNPPEPVPLSAERLAELGIAPPGSLEAWMLDPKLVADQTVRRFAKSEEVAQKILGNRIYQHTTAMVAGVHEYAAMKALHRFISEGRYELVVLDTPPSRNALDFLEAPSRLAAFIEGRTFKMFLPAEGGLMGRAASALVAKVLQGVFGKDFSTELTDFFTAFSGLFNALGTDLTEVKRVLKEKDAAFLLVTTPSSAALREAHFFHDKIGQLGLPLRGFILNKSCARTEGREFPDWSLAPADAPEALRTGLDKLKPNARSESLQAARDKGLLADLALRAGSGAFVMALPTLASGTTETARLLSAADIFQAERRSGPRI